MDKVQYSVGDVVRMKKAHPCGSYEWVITRTGIDFVEYNIDAQPGVARPKITQG